MESGLPSCSRYSSPTFSLLYSLLSFLSSSLYSLLYSTLLSTHSVHFVFTISIYTQYFLLLPLLALPPQSAYCCYHVSESAHSVLLQFLDCVHQIAVQYPSAFEFNEAFLVHIADEAYSCRYGTFLGNEPKVRADLNVRRKTVSVWTPVLQDMDRYSNPNYAPSPNTTLRPSPSVRWMELWKAYYLRYV